MKSILAFARRHLGAAIAATMTAVVLAGGLLILTTAGGGAVPASAGSPTAPSTTVAPAPPPASARHQGDRGQITALTATTWSVLSARGVPVTVNLTPTTAFGTKTAPLTAADFAVGDHVTVIGTRTKAAVTATRVAKAPAAVKPPAAAPPTSTH